MFSFADFLLLPPFAVTTADAVEPPTGLAYNHTTADKWVFRR
jgi:hypothetical protein